MEKYSTNALNRKKIKISKYAVFFNDFQINDVIGKYWGSGRSVWYCVIFLNLMFLALF